MIIFYTIHCPACRILEKQLQLRKIQYVEHTDVDYMRERGMTSMPMLEVDGVLMDFKEAWQWVTNQEVQN